MAVEIERTCLVKSDAGCNAGLVVAEIELAAIDEVFPQPDCLGREVSRLARYYTMSLAMHPYLHWNETERGALDAQ